MFPGGIRHSDVRGHVFARTQLGLLLEPGGLADALSEDSYVKKIDIERLDTRVKWGLLLTSVVTFALLVFSAAPSGTDKATVAKRLEVAKGSHCLTCVGNLWRMDEMIQTIQIKETA